MTKEEELFCKRTAELAETAYNQSRYTFTGFLNMAQQDLFLRTVRNYRHIPYTLFGGNEACERQMGRFGSPDLMGYEADFPIQCLKIEPLAPKFAQDIGHRDCLGALIHLGIDRSTLGDIFLKDNSAWLYCSDTISEFITNSLAQIKRTPVKCTAVSGMPEDLKPTLDELKITAASGRLDAVVASLFHLSRSKSQELFRLGRVFVNGRLTESTSCQLKPGDLISVRGFGRFYYDGIEGETRKGRARTAIRIFKS